jgi:hypothetical protein
MAPLFAGSDRSILIAVVDFDAGAVASNDRQRSFPEREE